MQVWKYIPPTIPFKVSEMVPSELLTFMLQTKLPFLLSVSRLIPTYCYINSEYDIFPNLCTSFRINGMLWSHCPVFLQTLVYQKLIHVFSHINHCRIIPHFNKISLYMDSELVEINTLPKVSSVSETFDTDKNVSVHH